MDVRNHKAGQNKNQNNYRGNKTEKHPRKFRKVGLTVMDVPGKGRKGRSRRRWMDRIKHDLTEKELSCEEAHK